MKSQWLFVVAGAAFYNASGLAADTVAEHNMAAEPPYVDGSKDSCRVELLFKPAVREDQHAYIIITDPAGKKTEVRGGPSKGGGGSSDGSGDQPSGNPFKCKTAHNWGVVVPYIGQHGLLGKDVRGKPLYSPDGNVGTPTKVVSIEKSAQKTSCQLANCLIQSARASGQSCQLYTVGTGKLRNSNTLISTALATCGVADPLPADISATGWGGGWFDK
mgnify:CR=1 FL=1